MKSWTRPPRLVPGQRCRMTEVGPVVTITRVNVCAAYYREGVPRTIVDPATGEERTFVSYREHAISSHSYVYPDGGLK